MIIQIALNKETGICYVTEKVHCKRGIGKSCDELLIYGFNAKLYPELLEKYLKEAKNLKEKK